MEATSQSPVAPFPFVGARPTSTRAMLLRVQREAFEYFSQEMNPANGLVADQTRPGAPCSIAAVGLALACYAVGVERGLVRREEAVRRTLAALRFFWYGPQGTGPEAIGYRGFYYHFLDMAAGRRVWRCELSTVDTAFLLAGALTAAAYFDGTAPGEREVRNLAEALYHRADWRWACDGGDTVSMGWRPESGLMRCTWRGYNEGLLLYALGLGSATHPLPDGSYAGWTSTYRWRRLYGTELFHAGPLFTHQLSHLWIDFRGLQDAPARERGLDYFENSRRATLLQQEYARRNPRGFAGYGERCWGLTACEGPGPARYCVEGADRPFADYRARGVPFGPDDGTLAPFAVVASLPFAPEIVLPTLRHMLALGLAGGHPYGLGPVFNPTFPAGRSGPYGWRSPYYFGIDQGPMVLMIENFLSGMPWELMRRCAPLVTGLRRAGFAGGWLS